MSRSESTALCVCRNEALLCMNSSLLLCVVLGPVCLAELRLVRILGLPVLESVRVPLLLRSGVCLLLLFLPWVLLLRCLSCGALHRRAVALVVRACVSLVRPLLRWDHLMLQD